MATNVLQVQVEDSLKDQATAVYEGLGIDLSAAVRIFLKQSVIENGPPSDLTAYFRRELVIQKGLKAIERMQDESERNGNSNMTLDEINAEIAASRAERRARRAEKERAAI